MTQPTEPAGAAPPVATSSIWDQKLIVTLVSLASVLVLSSMRLVDGTTVADFIKYVAIAYIGGGFVQGAATKIAIGTAAQGLPAGTPTHRAMLSMLGGK